MNAGAAVLPVAGMPEVAAGDSLAELIITRIELHAGDIVAIAQKVVSKAEGRRADPDRVEPGAKARELAAALDKDPGLVELILGESSRIVRSERVLIVETHSGLICANAGIDSSNVGPEGGVLLLPTDPDASARRIRTELAGSGAPPVAILITDSFGRPWRVGQTEVAIGCAGLDPLDDRRGSADRDSRELAATEIALADELSCAADLVRSKASGVPVVVIRGLGGLVSDSDGPGAMALRRSAGEDLFR